MVLEMHAKLPQRRGMLLLIEYVCFTANIPCLSILKTLAALMQLFSSYGGGLGRSPSFSSSGDAYGYDDGYRHGRRSRHSSFSNPAVVRVGGSPIPSPSIPGYAGSVPGAVPMPIPGQPMTAGSPYGAGVPGSYGAYGTPYAASQPGLPGSYGYGSGSLSGRVSPSPYGSPQPAAGGYTYNGMPVGGYGATASPYAGAAAQPGGYVLPNGQTAPPGSTIIINHRSRRHSSASRHHHHRSGSDYDRERDREWERERDWERADRERHERDRLRWEQEEYARERQQYGVDEYGRYGRVGSAMGGGYGYSGRY